MIPIHRTIPKYLLEYLRCAICGCVILSRAHDLSNIPPSTGTPHRMNSRVICINVIGNRIRENCTVTVRRAPITSSSRLHPFIVVVVDQIPQLRVDRMYNVPALHDTHSDSASSRLKVVIITVIHEPVLRWLIVSIDHCALILQTTVDVCTSTSVAKI